METVTEAVETCPHCMAENVLTYWDVQKHGYVVKCWNCGNEIFLCDECMHAEDNPGQKCDWHERIAGGKSLGGECFRGRTRKSNG